MRDEVGVTIGLTWYPNFSSQRIGNFSDWSRALSTDQTAYRYSSFQWV